MTMLASGSGVPSLDVGGRVFTDLKNLIVLYAEMGAGNRYSTLRKANGNATAGYQVTAGKTLKIFAVSAHITATLNNMRLSYADNDIGIYQAARALTNEVSQCGADNQGQVPVQNTGVAKSNIWFEVPATKYAQIDGATDVGVVFFYGYEE